MWFPDSYSEIPLLDSKEAIPWEGPFIGSLSEIYCQIFEKYFALRAKAYLGVQKVRMNCINLLTTEKQGVRHDLQISYATLE